MKIEDDGQQTLFQRLRESGQAAVRIAAWIPSFLQNDVNEEDLGIVVTSISTCLAGCEKLAQEAKATGDPRLAHTAQKVLGLWEMLGEKIAARA